MEGMLAEVVTACAGGAVITGWAMYLHCSALTIGILGALPFLAQFVQFPAAWLSSTLGYRRNAILAVSLSRQVLLPLIPLPFWDGSESAKQALLIAVSAASAVLGVIGNNAWVSWMGELVPRSIRGRYFGRRTGLTALGATLSSLAAGMVLDRAALTAHTGLALSVLAAVACLVGAITTVLLFRQHDPCDPSEVERFDLSATLLPIRDIRGRRVLEYRTAWNFGVGLSATLYSLHMLQNLKMGFAQVALYNAGVAAVRIVTAPLWGKAIDRVGSRTVLTVCSFGIAVVPVLWVLPTAEHLWPLAVDVFASGILWGGHGLASFALPLAVAPRKGRPFYLAAFATATGVFFAIGAAVGGLLATSLPEHTVWMGHPFIALHWVFLISAVGRFAAALLAPRIFEDGARTVQELFRMAADGARELPARIATRPALGLVPLRTATRPPGRPVPGDRSPPPTARL